MSNRYLESIKQVEITVESIIFDQETDRVIRDTFRYALFIWGLIATFYSLHVYCSQSQLMVRYVKYVNPKAPESRELFEKLMERLTHPISSSDISDDVGTESVVQKALSNYYKEVIDKNLKLQTDQTDGNDITALAPVQKQDAEKDSSSSIIKKPNTEKKVEIEMT